MLTQNTNEHQQCLHNELAQARVRQIRAQQAYGIFSDAYLEASADVTRLLQALGRTGKNVDETPAAPSPKPRRRHVEDEDDDWPDDRFKSSSETLRYRPTKDESPLDYKLPAHYEVQITDESTITFIDPTSKTTVTKTRIPLNTS